MIDAHDMEHDPSYWRARLRAKGLAVAAMQPGETESLLEACHADLIQAAYNASEGHCTSKNKKVIPVDPVVAACLKEAQDRVPVLVHNSISELLHAGVPLAGAHVDAAHLDERQQQSGGQPWWELIGCEPDLEASFGLSHAPPLCTLDDLADLMGAALLAMETQHRGHLSAPAGTAATGPQVARLQELMPELHPSERQVGVDDQLHSWFAAQQADVAAAVAAQGTSFVCRKFACTGVPAGLRRRVWEGALGLRNRAAVHQDAFGRLCKQAAAQQLLTDLFVEGAIQSVVSTEHFFLFEDPLRAVLLAFSRDPSVASSSRQPLTPSLCGQAPGSEQSLQYPPAGVMPHQTLALLSAPLCYLYSCPAGVYSMFRSLYCRYWCRLQCMQPLAGSLPHLCLVCLAILQETEPDVMGHLAATGIQLLPMLLPWLATAFVGHLPPSQVLLLWDRVVGFDTVLVLPCMAAAVVSFRRHMLLQSASAEAVAHVLEDLSEIQVVPLLQALLFGV